MKFRGSVPRYPRSNVVARAVPIEPVPNAFWPESSVFTARAKICRGSDHF